MSCCAYDDGPEFYTQKFPVARKHYKCCECRAEIKPGEVYERYAGMWEGFFSEFKTCEACADLRDSLGQVWCVSMERLKEDYREYCEAVGLHRYDEEQDEYFYPENHLRLNA